MAFTHTQIINYSAGGEQLLASTTYTGTSELRIDESVGDSVTDFFVEVSIDQSAIQSLYMFSDQDITIETNNSSAPTDTFVLQANSPYIFNVDQGVYNSNLITADVTAIYLTNASGSTANFKLRVLTDATP